MIGLFVAAQLAMASVNPLANELFDRDPLLMAWALKLYDANHDGWLTLFEAQAALEAFREIADADRDGRVTTHEYRRAKEFVAARWAVR
jgi:regulator of RNase E activity RraB